MLLTQSTTPIIGWIATLLGYVMEFIFYCLNFIGIQNIGLCIIIFTIIVRLLMLPLTIKQQKFAKISQVMQPEINKILILWSDAMYKPFGHIDITLSTFCHEHDAQKDQ